MGPKRRGHKRNDGEGFGNTYPNGEAAPLQTGAPPADTTNQEVQASAPRNYTTYLDLAQLRASPMPELRALAEKFQVSDYNRLSKEEIVFALLRAQAEVQGLRFSEGVLEILPDGYGFLRDKTLLPGKNDIYVSPSKRRGKVFRAAQGGGHRPGRPRGNAPAHPLQ